ncbi:MAG: M15 family metallopeptidase [Candidatus Woesebacteria bacterium]|nr:M15 family metallopeptidase [Candidatus Woesebacteria bacterium]
MKEIDTIGTLVENDLGIHFIKPDLKLLNDLYKNLDYLSRSFNTQILFPDPPDEGFLRESLTNNQSKVIDGLLSEKYAEIAVQLQDKLVDSVNIKESGEEMVSLPLLFKQNNIPLSLSDRPFHDACGEWAGKERVFWARKGVSEKVLLVGRILQSLGIKLHLEDVFRPLGVQEGLFFRRVKLTLQQHPDWVNDWKKVWAEARSKTAVTPFTAGHKSGAAVDVTLRRMDGTNLSLGNKYPEGGSKVAIRFPYITQEEWSTRQIFILTMEMANLRIYPFENWHASYGDLSAGIAAFSDTDVTLNYKGIYGPIKGFSIETGEVEPYKEEDYFDPFFTEDELMRALVK